MPMLFPNSSRQVEPVQAPWFFRIDVDQIGEKDAWYAPSMDSSQWSQVAVPSAWNLYTEALWGYEGVGWYITDLPAQAAHPGLRQRLVFGRVAWHARVWLNGELLGEHLGGDLPFEFDLRGRLHPDQPNRLAVRVDNAPRLEWLPGSLVIERVTYGGILSPVLLETLGEVSIDSLLITAVPDGAGAKVICQAHLSNAGTQDFHGALAVAFPDWGSSFSIQQAFACRAGEIAVCSLDVRLPAAQPWSPEHPVLYPIQARVIAPDGQPVDEVFTRFGVRTVATRGQQILLNGQPLAIRGVNLYVEYPGVGPVATRAQIMRDLLEIKAAGANFIRFPCPVEPVVYDLMDEIGLMGDEEVYINWWGMLAWPGTSPAADNAATILPEGEEWLRVMIARDFNHPSIIFWGMANESATHEPVGIEAMRRLMALGKQLDPTRLVSFIVTGDAREHLAFEQADLVAANLYPGVFGEQTAYTTAEIEEKGKKPAVEWLLRYAEYFKDKPIIISEWGAHGICGLYGEARYTEDH